MNVEIKSDATVKHIRNLLAICKEGKFDLDGIRAVALGEAFVYLLELSSKIEEQLKNQADD